MVIKPIKKKNHSELLNKLLKALIDIENEKQKEIQLNEFKQVNNERIEQVKKEINNNNQIKILKNKRKNLEDGNKKLDQQIVESRDKSSNLSMLVTEIGKILSNDARELGKIEVVIYPIEYFEDK